MKYLLENIKDLNTSFILKPYDPQLFILFGNNDKLLLEIYGDVYNPILPQSEEAIISSWLLYELDNFEEDFEKVSININQYNPKKHFAKFKFDKLDELLNINDFKNDIEQSVLLSQRRFKEDVIKGLLNAKTDFKIKYLLNKKIVDLNNAINSLKEIKANKTQNLVKNIYLKNYLNTINHLKSEYGEYLPKVLETELNKMLIHNKLDYFLTLETELIERDFIIKSGDTLQWSSKKGFKIKLVSFCRLLEYHKYINKFVDIKRVIDFLEKRYNIEIGDQKKPSKYDKQSIKIIEADFFFLKF